MFSAKEHQNKLKQDAKNILFDQEFAAEVERQIAEKKALKGKSLVEQMKLDSVNAPKKHDGRFSVPGDDEHNTLMWRALMKDCAYYFDVPNIDDEI